MTVFSVAYLGRKSAIQYFDKLTKKIKFFSLNALKFLQKNFRFDLSFFLDWMQRTF